MFEATLTGLGYLLEPQYWYAFWAAMFLSIVVSVVPGVSSILVMAITLPFIILNVSDPAIGIVMLAAIAGTNNTLDSIPAVLLGLPSSATQVTFLEGHQLARQGKAAHTLGAIFSVSAIGGVFGALILAVSIPVIRPFVLSFSFGEIAVIALFGLAMVSILSRGAMLKGLTAACVGLLLASVRIEPFNGAERFIFGWYDLVEGLPIIAVIVGIFALPEIIDLSIRGRAVSSGRSSDISTAEVWRGALYGLKEWKVTLRQSAFGVVLGAIPGVGSSVVDWLSYAFGMIFVKDRSLIGKGWLDGVLFAEAAQNSKEGGQAIPTLALGIPGGTGWVIILVAMLAYGVSPGPQMLDPDGTAHITVVLVITLALGNLTITILGLLAARQMVRLTTIPYPAIAATITPIVIMTAYLQFLGWIAIPIVMIFTGVGLVMKIYGWPRPPLILGFILGKVIENNFWSGLSVHGAVGLATRPLTIILVFFIIATVVGLNVALSRNDSVLNADKGMQQSTTVIAKERGSSGLPSFHWEWENIVPLILVIAGTLGVIESMGFSDRGRPFPLYTSGAIGVLSLLIFLRASFKQKQESNIQIMDLAMSSSGEPGAGKRALILSGLLLLYMASAVAIGIEYGAIIFAALSPIFLMQGKWRWLASAISAGLVTIFIYAFAGYLMATVWPTPALPGWLGF